MFDIKKKISNTAQNKIKRICVTILLNFTFIQIPCYKEVNFESSNDFLRLLMVFSESSFWRCFDIKQGYSLRFRFLSKSRVDNK